MGTIINLADKRPYFEGECFCLDCKHKWVGIAPRGVVWLECPKCGLVRGRFKYQIERAGHHWFCNCGNELFCVTPDGYYCPNCGEWQIGF